MKMDFDEVEGKEKPGVCRCCLAEGCFRVIGLSYQHLDEMEDYDKMLMYSLNICISPPSDGSTRLICEVCINHLREACSFKRQVQSSESRFIDMVHRADLPTIEKMEAFQDFFFKSEPEPEIQCADGIGHDDSDMSDEDSKPLTVVKLHLRGASGDRAPPASAPPRRGRGRPLKSGRPRADKPAKTTSLKSHESRPTHRRRQNLERIFNNTTVIPFKWRGNYLCYYCGKTLAEYTELRKHTLAHGKCSHRDYALKSIRTADMEVKIDVSDIACELCNDRFADFEKVVTHLNLTHGVGYDSQVSVNLTKYRLADLACLECGEVMGSFKKLVGHVNKSHPVSTFACEVCSKPFSKRRDLLAHARTFHKDGGYDCDECGANFDSSTKMRAHKESNHLLVCAVCFATFSTTERRRQHMNDAHLKDGVCVCEFCKTSWNTRLAYLQHLRRCKARKNASAVAGRSVKAGDEGPYKEVKSIRQNLACILNMSNAIPFKFYMSTFRCFYCPTNFGHSDELRAHTHAEHPVCDVKHNSMRLRARQDVDIKIDIASLSCKICLETIEGLDALVEHLVAKHQAKYDTTINLKLLPFKLIKDKYPCLLCSESVDFKFFVNLLKHVNEAHSNNKVLCVYCGEAFRSKNNMRSHIQMHHAPPKIECPECKQAFHTGSKLAAHIARAHGKNVFKCNKCPDKFATPYIKRRHMIDVHNIGSKCPHCSKMFTGNSIMLSHIRRTHLKEKTVECPVCHLKMFDVHMMKIHMVRHEGERNFHCDVCGKKFMWKKNLRNHMSVHDKGV